MTSSAESTSPLDPSTKSLGTRQWDSKWDSLPREIRILILTCLTQDGCPLARLATVCREWQEDIERHNFARIRLTRARLDDFSAMIERNQALVRYIWFCLEAGDYDCDECGLNGITRVTDPRELNNIFSAVIKSFRTLFTALGKWDSQGDLTLDISFYSPSDSEHWFKYLTFVPDAPSEMLDNRAEEAAMPNRVYHDPKHGWVSGRSDGTTTRAAIFKAFSYIMVLDTHWPHRMYFHPPVDQPEVYWGDHLPRVPAVTSLLLRQQNRARLVPEQLAYMLSRFPRLQEVHWEPWRTLSVVQPAADRLTGRDYEGLFKSIQRCNNSLKSLVVFENFNQQYPATMWASHCGYANGFNIIRDSDLAVARSVVLASLKLEHLAASFFIDAGHFFDTDPAWEWPNLTSLVLTSQLLTPATDPAEIGAMLRAAAAAAMKMPRLKTMEIWNGRKGLAALFRFEALRNEGEAAIVWRGTWELAMEPATIQAWKDVMHQWDGRRLNLSEELLHKDTIKSHGDALRYLKLSGQVIRPVSLQQILREQKALEGVPTHE